MFWVYFLWFDSFISIKLFLANLYMLRNSWQCFLLISNACPLLWFVICEITVHLSGSWWPNSDQYWWGNCVLLSLSLRWRPRHPKGSCSKFQESVRTFNHSIQSYKVLESLFYWSNQNIQYIDNLTLSDPAGETRSRYVFARLVIVLLDLHTEWKVFNYTMT